MNYQEMTDFEINKSVAKMSLNFDRGAGVPISGTSILQWFDGCEWHKFDPCNSWADAGPIIQENRISIFSDSEDDCHSNNGDKVYWWNAISFDTGLQHNAESNPLRAAMVVFLMMKGGE